MTLSFLQMMTSIQIPFLTHDVLILKMITFQISFLIYELSKVAFHHASPKVMIQYISSSTKKKRKKEKKRKIKECSLLHTLCYT